MKAKIMAGPLVFTNKKSKPFSNIMDMKNNPDKWKAVIKVINELKDDLKEKKNVELEPLFIRTEISPDVNFNDKPENFLKY